VSVGLSVKEFLTVEARGNQIIGRQLVQGAVRVMVMVMLVICTIVVREGPRVAIVRGVTSA